MPIDSPALDDLDFATIRDQLVRRIPIVAPEWTDHNDSDPGITLIQLFAYLAEQIGYRLNRVPDKNYIEFLKLIGMRLRPAESARTQIEFILSKPELAQAFVIPAGSRVKAKPGKAPPGEAAPPAPVFETDVDVDAVPAQLAALVTTQSDDLRQVKLPADTDAQIAATDYVATRFSLAWDGKVPKLKDMPTQPVPLFQLPSEKDHRHLWIGLAFNPARPAGFVGQRVTLTVQLDDDEQPSAAARVLCGETPADVSDAIAESDPTRAVTYRYYQPAQAGETQGSWQALVPIADSTDAWTRSGQIRFDVPTTIVGVTGKVGIPDAEWKEIRAPKVLSLKEMCDAAAADPSARPPPPPIAHPLPGKLKTPVDGAPALVPISGWIDVALPALVPGFSRKLSIRAVSFNVAAATNAETVLAEFVARGTGLPGQTVQLGHGDVLAGTLELAVTDPIDELLHTWREVDDFDGMAADAQVYVLDREAGRVTFGDGRRGRPPAAQTRIVALRYRHGGGVDAELAAGLVTQPDQIPTEAQEVVNIVAARGGKDAETLEEAKLRAPKELKVLGRAVTAEDFELLARWTEGVRVARAVTVPLRRPYTDPIAMGPGLDMESVLPGALSVVVVPDEKGLYPTPTEGMLRTVCRQLDRYRLVTTEVYVVPPMYVRLFDVQVIVRAKPGYTRTLLREAIAARLETYFHALTGGSDGKGFPFGGTLHHADVMAQVFGVEGVERVELVDAMFDGQSPAGAVPPQVWRAERQAALHLTNCVVDESVDRVLIELAADENVFVDTSNLLVTVR